MKNAKKVVYLIIVLNILFQIVYSTIGRGYSNHFIFYIFRPEYMLISGIIAFLVFIFHIMLLIRSAEMNKFDIIALILNIEFMAYYIRFLSLQ